MTEEWRNILIGAIGAVLWLIFFVCGGAIHSFLNTETLTFSQNISNGFTFALMMNALSLVIGMPACIFALHIIPELPSENASRYLSRRSCFRPAEQPPRDYRWQCRIAGFVFANVVIIIALWKFAPKEFYSDPRPPVTIESLIDLLPKN